MERAQLIRLLRVGLLLTLFSNYLFIFIGPTGWHNVYLNFNSFAAFLPVNPLTLGYISLFLLFLIQIWNLRKDPLPEGDLAVALLLWTIKFESSFAHCHWSEVVPYLFILLFLENRLSKKKIHFDFFLFLRVFVSLIYFSSFLQRLLDPSWQSGLFLSQFLRSPVFSKLAGTYFVSIIPAWPILTYAVLFVEFLGALLPFRKFTRPIVLLLLPIHLFLWFFSTESIWQMLFIVLLVIIFLESENLKYTPSKIGRYVHMSMLALFAILYLSAIPYDFRLKVLMAPVSWARVVADTLTLQPLYNQRLFHAAPYKAFCPKIAFRSAKASGDIVSLYSVTPENCVVKGQGWIQDHLYHSLLQYILTLNSWDLKFSHYSEIQRESQMYIWQNRTQSAIAAAICANKLTQIDDDTEAIVLATTMSGKSDSIRIKTHIISNFQCIAGQIKLLPSLDPRFSDFVSKHEKEIEDFLGQTH